MSIDLGYLGLILTLVGPVLLQLESMLFKSVDPKTAETELASDDIPIFDELIQKVFNRMQDDILRTSDADHRGDIATIQRLDDVRPHVAKDLGKEIWDKATARERLRGCLL